MSVCRLITLISENLYTWECIFSENLYTCMGVYLEKWHGALRALTQAAKFLRKRSSFCLV